MSNSPPRGSKIVATIATLSLFFSAINPALIASAMEFDTTSQPSSLLAQDFGPPPGGGGAPPPPGGDPSGGFTNTAPAGDPSGGVTNTAPVTNDPFAGTSTTPAAPAGPNPFSGADPFANTNTAPDPAASQTGTDPFNTSSTPPAGTDPFNTSATPPAGTDNTSTGNLPVPADPFGTATPGALDPANNPDGVAPGTHFDQSGNLQTPGTDASTGNAGDTTTPRHTGNPDRDANDRSDFDRPTEDERSNNFSDREDFRGENRETTDFDRNSDDRRFNGSETDSGKQKKSFKDPFNGKFGGDKEFKRGEFKGFGNQNNENFQKGIFGDTFEHQEEFNSDNFFQPPSFGKEGNFENFKGVEFDRDSFKNQFQGETSKKQFGEYKFGLDQYEFQIDEENVKFDREKENAGQKVREIKQEGQRANQEIKRMRKDIDRVIKRAGGLQSCPPIAEAKLALQSAATAADIMSNVSDANLKQAIGAAQKLGFGGGGPGQGGFGPPQGFGGGGSGQGGFGPSQGFSGDGSGQGEFESSSSSTENRGGNQNNFGGFGQNPSDFFGGNLLAQAFGGFQQSSSSNDGLWQKVMMAVGKTHMCEGIAHGLKEIARFKKDITREASRVTDQTALSALETHLESLTDLETNYASYIEWDNEFGDPMYPLFEAMDKIRFAIEEIVFAQHDTMEHDNACGAFPEIKAHMSSSAASNVPADLATKVAKLVAKGEKACAEGEIKVAFDVLDFMERKIRPEIERYMDISEGGREDDFNFGVDKDEILQEAFTANIGDTEGVDIAALVAKIEKKMLSKMQKAVEAAVDAVTQKFMAKIAVMESKFAEAISDKMAAVMDNVTVGFQGVLKDKIMNTKVGLSEVQGELDNVVANVDLTTETENNYEELLEYATVRNFSSTAADQVQKQIGAVTNALSLASDETEAKTTATEEIATALENVKAIYKADKTTQLEEGILPFGDLHGGEEKWYAGYAAAAKGAGIVKGETDEEGVANMNADKATNIAEGLTMLARTAAGGADNITTAIDTSNPVVNRLPEWAQAPASYLANERGMDLEAILGGKIADDSMTRGEMMHAASQAFSLQAEDESGTLGAFNDQESISSAQKAGVAALVEAGVVSGEGTTGNVNTEGELNRAAFAKIMIEAEKVAETE